MLKKVTLSRWFQRHFRRQKSVHRKHRHGGCTCCGFNLKDWLFLICFTTLVYSGFTLIWFCYYEGFKAVINNIPLDKMAFKIAYHLGYPVPNTLIDRKRLTDVPKFLPFLGNSENLLEGDAILDSMLDFPALTHVPHRYGGEHSDTPDYRSKNYKAQMDQFLKEWPYNQAVDGVQVLNCTEENFAALHEAINKINSTQNPWGGYDASCHVDQEDWFKNGFCAQYDIRDQDRQATIGAAYFESGANHFSICFFIKLANVMGFFPSPYDIDRIRTEINTLEAQRPDVKIAARDLLMKTADTPYKELVRVKLLCFHDLQSHPDLISFMPGPYISGKHFPYVGQKSYTLPAALMRLDFQGRKPSSDVITVECRAMALNSGLNETGSLQVTKPYGHFKLRLGYSSNPVRYLIKSEYYYI